MASSAARSSPRNVEDRRAIGGMLLTAGIGLLGIVPAPSNRAKPSEMHCSHRRDRVIAAWAAIVACQLRLRGWRTPNSCS